MVLMKELVETLVLMLVVVMMMMKKELVETLVLVFLLSESEDC